jgi:UDP-glucuronate 4-epimerase
MARYLVTGAAGFIGSHVSDALLDRGDEVVGVDDFNDFYDPRLKEENASALLSRPGFSLVRGDLLDESVRATCFEGAPYEAVIHLAASAGVRPSIERPGHYQRNNVEVTTALLEDLRRLRERSGHATRMVMASSSSVYGANQKVPFHEDDNVDHPVSPYAATKKCCELLGYTYHHLFGLDVACLRFFTVYGPRQRPEMAIHKFAALMMAGDEVPMYGDGTSGRDYTFIDDIVQGVVASVDKSRGYRVYNLGNHDVVTLKDLIEKLGRALGVTPRVRELPDQPGDVPLTYADISRARAELGYEPRTSIDEGLAAFAAWFLSRQGAAKSASAR